MRRFGAVLTTRGRAFCSAGITLLVCGYTLGFRDLTRVGVLLLVLPLLAGLLARRRPPGLVVTRSTDPVQVSAGDTATVTTTVANNGRRSTPLMLAEEHLGYSLGERPRVLLGSLGRGQRRGLSYAVRPPVRGRHPLGPLTVQLRDPFGLTQRFVDVGEPTELLVLPAVHPLGGTHPRGTGVGADGEIPFMVALHGEDDQSIRDYRDGDDLRRIHWPATARTGDLMVRQEDRPARRRAVIVLDPRANGHLGAGAASSFEWAVSMAASVAVHLGSLGYAVHLLTQETLHAGLEVPPMDPVEALHVLAVTEPEADAGVGLDRITRAGRGLLSGGGLFVAVVSAHDENDLRSILTMRRPGATALAFLVDAGSWAGSPSSAARNTGAVDVGQAVELFRGAGWHATGVTAADSVPDAWARVGSRVGARGSAGVGR